LTSASATHVEKDASSPRIPEAPGVVITGPAQATTRTPLVLHGAFHLTYAEADELGRPAHRGLVLVIQRDEDYNAVTPFREHVLFADDEVGARGGVGGYFHMDVFEEQGGPAPGHYHLLVSIGERVSAVHEVWVVP
jgi:hypothetical protein